MSQSVKIVRGFRTAIGSFQGALAPISAPQLGAGATRALIEGIEPQIIDELLFGCVLSAGLGQAPARQVALGAGLPQSVSCSTINKVCGSGMKAVILAQDQIQAGSSDAIIAGGMESMSKAPYLMNKVRTGLRMGHSEMKDHLFFDGLEDAYSGRLMGSFAQDTADRSGISRQEMDDFTIESLQRAQEAGRRGYFNDEITPFDVVSRKGTTTVSDDELPLKANLEKIPHLRPVFKQDGSITAANSSSISDGAAALLLMTAAKARQQGLQPLASIVAHASHAQEPSEYTSAPIQAIEKVLQRAGWVKKDVDLFEVNEAFAMVALLSMRALDIDHNKLNIQGGACALGHPIGCSGARIIVTLIHSLRRLGKQRGVASLCIGGGEATAIAIEMV